MYNTFQRNQIITCESNTVPTSLLCFNSCQSSNFNQTHSKIYNQRIYSQQKSKSKRKIELTISKKGRSQSKDNIPFTRTNSLSQNTPYTRQNISKNVVCQKPLISVITKKQSYSTYNRHPKLGSLNEQKKGKVYLKLDNNRGLIKNENNNQTQQLTSQKLLKFDLPSMNLCSQISFVQQDFLSQGSATLQATNLINSIKQQTWQEKLNQNPCKRQNYHTSNMAQITKTPLQRLIERKNNSKSMKRKQFI